MIYSSGGGSVLVHNEREAQRGVALPNQADQAPPERLLSARSRPGRVVRASGETVRGIAAEAEARTTGAAHASAADGAGEGGGDGLDAAARLGALVGTATDVARA